MKLAEMNTIDDLDAYLEEHRVLHLQAGETIYTLGKERPGKYTLEERGNFWLTRQTLPEALIALTIFLAGEVPA